jgi:hypothetical protein
MDFTMRFDFFFQTYLFFIEISTDHFALIFYSESVGCDRATRPPLEFGGEGVRFDGRRWRKNRWWRSSRVQGVCEMMVELGFWIVDGADHRRL